MKLSSQGCGCMYSETETRLFGVVKMIVVNCCAELGRGQPSVV
jgi:hypothetical protein